MEEQEPGLKKPGAKKIPEQWTRVINIHSDDPRSMKPYVLGTDLLLMDGFRPIPDNENTEPWKPVFISKDFVINNPELNLQEYKMDVTTLQ